MNRFRTPGGEQYKGLLELMKKIPNNCVIIEVGSAYGESAEVFLSTGKVKKIYCIDPWKDNEGREDEFDRRHGKDERVVKMKMTGDEAVKYFQDGIADLVYIDACHTYKDLTQDINNYISKGKWIGGHDYSYWFPGVIQAVAERFTFPHYVFRDSSWLCEL